MHPTNGLHAEDEAIEAQDMVDAGSTMQWCYSNRWLRRFCCHAQAMATVREAATGRLLDINLVTKVYRRRRKRRDGPAELSAPEGSLFDELEVSRGPWRVRHPPTRRRGLTPGGPALGLPTRSVMPVE